MTEQKESKSSLKCRLLPTRNQGHAVNLCNLYKCIIPSWTLFKSPAYACIEFNTSSALKSHNAYKHFRTITTGIPKIIGVQDHQILISKSFKFA
jgi:hypothetical protein